MRGLAHKPNLMDKSSRAERVAPAGRKFLWAHNVLRLALIRFIFTGDVETTFRKRERQQAMQPVPAISQGALPRWTPKWKQGMQAACRRNAQLDRIGTKRERAEIVPVAGTNRQASELIYRRSRRWMSCT
jgi:hypothetical protein